MSDLNVPRISRRTLLGAVGAGAATASMGWAAVKQEVEALQKKGWSAHPVACCVCGARSGLLAMHKDGEKPSRKTVRILPNPDHPQRGYCGRGAQALWAWDHPMRIKKPLKRKGERGSGEFEEISWDQALNEIAGKLKAIVEKYGGRAGVGRGTTCRPTRTGLPIRWERPTSSITPRPATRPPPLVAA